MDRGCYGPGPIRAALGSVALLASCSAGGVPQRCDVTVPPALLSRPVPPGAPLGAAMGVQVQSWYLKPGDLDRIAAAGFGTVRWGVPWDLVETAPGSYDWREADKFVAALAASRLRSVFILGFGNHLYAGPGGTPAAKSADARVEARPPSDPVAQAAFARFAAAAAARYRDQPITWEIWNEPDSATFWKPTPDPTAYARLVGGTCRAIRAAAPRATVLGGAGAALPNAVAESDNIYAAMAHEGAFGCLDGVSGHAYRMSGHYHQPDPDSAEADIAASRQYLHSRLKLPRTKRFDITEWGYPASIIGADRQAAYLLRGNLTNAAAGVPLTIWYEWRDSRDDADDPESHFGLSTMTGGTKSGALAMLGQLAQARIVAMLQPSCDAAKALMIDERGKRLIVFWLRSDDTKERVPFVVNGVRRGDLSYMPSMIELPAG